MKKQKNTLISLLLTSMFLFSCSTTPVSNSDPVSETSQESEISESWSDNYISDFNFISYGDGTCSLVDCPNTEEVIVPEKSPNGDTVVYIGIRNAFEHSNVKKIILPGSVLNVGSFCGWCSLEEIILPEGLETIRTCAFKGCPLKKITIPGTVKEFGESSFEECTSLEEATFSEGLEEISKGAFEKCTSLERVTFPSTLGKIDYNAFRGCSSLNNMTLPDSLKEIEGLAFYQCVSLESVTLPKNLERVGTPTGDTDWNYCSFDENYNLTSLIIEDGVKKIYGFRASNLSKVFIPNSVCFPVNGVFDYNLNKSLTIYCEAESQPSDWSPGWNAKNIDCTTGYYNVVWGASRSDVE